MERSNKWVKQAMLQGIGHLIAVSPSDCNVACLFPVTNR